VASLLAFLARSKQKELENFVMPPAIRCPLPPSRIINYAFQLGYKMAYMAWRLYLTNSSRKLKGAQVVVKCGEYVLLVKSSYRSEYTLPGGYLRRSESFVDGACRELREETGIVIQQSQLRPMLMDSRKWAGNESSNMLYECNLNYAPKVSIDNREIVYAGFVKVSDALSYKLDDIARASLSHNSRK